MPRDRSFLSRAEHVAHGAPLVEFDVVDITRCLLREIDFLDKLVARQAKKVVDLKQEIAELKGETK